MKNGTKKMLSWSAQKESNRPKNFCKVSSVNKKWAALLICAETVKDNRCKSDLYFDRINYNCIYNKLTNNVLCHSSSVFNTFASLLTACINSRCPRLRVSNLRSYHRPSRLRSPPPALRLPLLLLPHRHLLLAHFPHLLLLLRLNLRWATCPNHHLLPLSIS